MSTNAWALVIIALFLFGNTFPAQGQDLTGSAVPHGAASQGQLVKRAAFSSNATVPQAADSALDYSGQPALVYDVGDNVQAFALRITAPFDGGISTIAFPLYNGALADGSSAAGISGTGTLRLTLFPDTVQMDDFYDPAAIDSIDVQFTDLEADSVEYASSIDVSEKNFDVSENSSYIVQFRVLNESSAGYLNFMTDNGTQDARTMLYFNGDEQTDPGYYTAVNRDGSAAVNLAARLVLMVQTDVAPLDQERLEGYALHGNHPNPVKRLTHMTFDLQAPGHTTLKVYDVMGREVRTLVAQRLTAGTHRTTMDATRLPAGTYIFRLRSGSFVQQRAMTVIR